MFKELKEAWITERYMSYKAILLPSMTKQLDVVGLILDLDSLPVKPFPFKELFIRWLISINKERLDKDQPILINKTIVMACPLWRIVKCPLKSIKLTKDGIFNKPTRTTKTIGTKGSIGTINNNTKH